MPCFMEHLTIEIDLNNEAFEEPGARAAEIRRICNYAVELLERGDLSDAPARRLRDINGNIVGHAALVECDRDEWLLDKQTGCNPK